MQVKTVIANSIPEFKEKLNNLGQEGFKPSLAIVFSHSQFDNVDVGAFLANKAIDFIGCSSAGEIVDGTVYSESISATFFEMDCSKYHILKQIVEEDQSYKEGLILGQKAKEKFANPVFITVFGMQLNVEDIIAGVKDAVGNEPFIYGGMASDDTEFSNPYVFTENAYERQSIHTIIFDNDQIEIEGLATAGWEAIGTSHVITKGKDNIVYEINNEPALDFFTNFFGFYTDPLTQTDAVSTVNAQYPLQVIRGGELVLRAPLQSNVEEKSLILGGSIIEGEKFKFSVAPSFDVINDTIGKFQGFKENIKNVPDALILFSCKARHWAFGPMIEEEIEALGTLWDIPFHGFFSFGEMGKNKGRNVNFLNETCCFITIKDKKL